MKKLVIMTLVVIFVLTGCNKKEEIIEEKSIWDVDDEEADSLETIELTIEDIQQKANENRRDNQKCKYDSSYGETHKEDALAITPEIAKKIKHSDSDIGYEYRDQVITVEQAKEDALIYSDIIKSSYGAYYLFEKELWEDALANSLTSIDNLKKENITGEELKEMLLNSYLFVNDDHFKIGGTSTLEASGGYYFYCYYALNDFYKDARGYFTFYENKKWYLTKIGTEENIEPFMKPTITIDGSLAYQIGTFLKDSESRNIKLSFTRGGVTNTIDAKYCKSKSLMEKSNNYVRTTAGIYDGYYVMSIRDFQMNKGKPFEELYQYALEAKKLKGTSNFIIDSRWNGGGGDVYLTGFYENYTGEKLTLNISEVLRHSRITLRTNDYLGSETRKADGTYAENKNLFVYLIDKNVCSAGERGILSIRQMDNALIIGTNSRGCIVTGCTCYYLPNSSIIVSAGDGACIEGNCSMEIEGLGWMPDIFVDGYLALDRTIKMYKYYGLLPDANVNNLDTWGGIIPTFEITQ